MPSSGSSSVTAGVNLGTDTSASIQFSMSANWSELKFTSKTSAATGVYGATWCDGSRSDYTQYSSEYLGAFIFQYKGDSGVYLYMDAKYYGTYSGVISKDSKGMVLKKTGVSLCVFASFIVWRGCGTNKTNQIPS